MTREEARKVLLQHSEHWKRLLTENICSKEEGSQTVEAFNMAIQALEQEPCDDMTTAYLMGYYADKEPCDDAEQIDYHDDFETALRKIHDYEERQKQNDKKCGNCKLIGTDSCYMVCGGSKSLYKPKQKSEPCDDVVSRQSVLDLIEHYNSDGLGSVFYGYEEGVKFANAVNKLPPVRPQEQTGHWINKEFRKEEYVLTGKCSVCGRVRVIDEYCPNCGCRMVEPQESEERSDKE